MSSRTVETIVTTIFPKVSKRRFTLLNTFLIRFPNSRYTYIPIKVEINNYVYVQIYINTGIHVSYITQYIRITVLIRVKVYIKSVVWGFTNRSKGFVF